MTGYNQPHKTNQVWSPGRMSQPPSYTVSGQLGVYPFLYPSLAHVALENFIALHHTFKMALHFAGTSSPSAALPHTKGLHWVSE